MFQFLRLQHLGSQDDAAIKIKNETHEKIGAMNKQVAANKDMVSCNLCIMFQQITWKAFFYVVISNFISSLFWSYYESYISLLVCIYYSKETFKVGIYLDYLQRNLKLQKDNYDNVVYIIHSNYSTC